MKNSKVNDSSGSVLIVVILALSLVSIVIMAISSQVNNQIKFNSSTHENMQYKYLAESSIENTISDIKNSIENQIYNTKYKEVSYNSSHLNCPKVGYKDGKHEIPFLKPGVYTEDGFIDLIHQEILQSKINIHSWYQTVLYENIKMIDEEKAKELRDYYQVSIRGQVDKIIQLDDNKNNENKLKRRFTDFKQNLDEFIDMLNETIFEIESIDDDNSVAILGLKEMVSHMVEIKCRLGLNVENPELEDNENIVLTEYTYNENSIEDGVNVEKNNENEIILDITKDDNGDVSAIQMDKVIDKYGDVKYDVISNTLEIVGYSSNSSTLQREYTITAKVKFYLTDLNDIKYEILSYEHKRN